MSYSPYLYPPSSSRINPRGTVWFSGYVQDEYGERVPYVDVYIWYSGQSMWLRNMDGTYVHGMTDIYGSFDIPWVVPFRHPTGNVLMPCSTHTFQAYYGGYSNIQSVTIAYLAQLFKDSSFTQPGINTSTLIVVNVPFNVTGYLARETGDGMWSPHGGQAIDLYVDGVFRTSGTTNSSGLFNLTTTISLAGSHSLRVSFGGGTSSLAAPWETIISIFQIPHIRVG